MKKVLIVEDDKDILHLVNYLLRKFGYNVYPHSSGLNVPEIVADYKPDVILLDIKLPEKSGIDICKEIKQAHPIPVVLFSAHADQAQSLQECRADAFVHKPFDINHLLNTIGSFSCTK